MFYKSQYGYKVATINADDIFYNHIEEVYGFFQCVTIHGSFNFKPVRGQFCKRPHRLINWS